MSAAPPRTGAAGVGERLLALRVRVFVWILRLLIRRGSVPRLLRLAALRAPSPPADVPRVVRCVDRVLADAAASRNACLARSLTLYRFLGGEAADLQFCLGVRYAQPGRGSRRIAGHAWLTRYGLPYLEQDHFHVYRFRVIYRYPPRQRSVA
jgi:hypothetical protein